MGPSLPVSALWLGPLVDRGPASLPGHSCILPAGEPWGLSRLRPGVGRGGAACRRTQRAEPGRATSAHGGRGDWVAGLGAASLCISGFSFQGPRPVRVQQKASRG